MASAVPRNYVSGKKGMSGGSTKPISFFGGAGLWGGVGVAGEVMDPLPRRRAVFAGASVEQ